MSMFKIKISKRSFDIRSGLIFKYGETFFKIISDHTKVDNFLVYYYNNVNNTIDLVGAEFKKEFLKDRFLNGSFIPHVSEKSLLLVPEKLRDFYV